MLSALCGNGHLTGYHIQQGIPDAVTADAADLYWDAFGGKLGFVMGPRARGMAFVTRVMNPRQALCALDADGQLLGLVGFKTPEGALVGGTFVDLAAIYGWFGAVWRAGLLSAIDRETDNERFLMDGIIVAEAARGRGIGSALLHAMMDEGRTRGYAMLRLDVIDSNHRARALYDRLDFAVLKTRQMGLLRHVFGFRSATTMVKPL